MLLFSGAVGSPTGPLGDKSGALESVVWVPILASQNRGVTLGKLINFKTQLFSPQNAGNVSTHLLGLCRLRLQRQNAWHTLSTEQALAILTIPLTSLSWLTHESFLIFSISRFIKGSKDKLLSSCSNEGFWAKGTMSSHSFSLSLFWGLLDTLLMGIRALITSQGHCQARSSFLKKN